jgi:hypothetical protein
MSALRPGNIWSGNRQLAVFTNPTCLAKRKGCLRDNYPVTFGGMVFPDAEAAYQYFSRDVKGDAEDCYAICEEVVLAKLTQHPRIALAIKISGGVPWIAACSHWVFGRRANPGRWEGDGLASGYLRCLAKAYERLNLM